jgi:hypothetical protein
MQIELDGVFNADVDSGIPHGRELFAFASAVLAPDLRALDAARAALDAAMGPAAVVSAALIAGDFSLVDRAANGIGISVEPMVLKPSEDFRARFGINEFPSAVNTLGQ